MVERPAQLSRADCKTVRPRQFCQTGLACTEQTGQIYQEGTDEASQQGKVNLNSQPGQVSLAGQLWTRQPDRGRWDKSAGTSQPG